VVFCSPALLGGLEALGGGDWLEEVAHWEDDFEGVLSPVSSSLWLSGLPGLHQVDSHLMPALASMMFCQKADPKQ
jgi:hypothetical protein